MKASTLYFILAELSFPFGFVGFHYPDLWPFAAIGYSLGGASIALNWRAHRTE